MSVGHAARVIEEAGIPTVVVLAGAFATRAKTMCLPRVLVTPHIMGRPLSAPGDVERQRAVLNAAFDLLESADANGAMEEFPEFYSPGQ